MRIIAGQSGGIPLRVPKGDFIRPTTDRVRTSLFDRIAARVPGAAVLDLFAGCGALGIEALSRGAARATFVERHNAAIDAIGSNLGKARLDGGEIRKADAVGVLKRLAAEGARFDLIFADPPYKNAEDDEDWGAALLRSPHLAEILAPGGLFVLETRAGDDKEAEAAAHGWAAASDTRYGTNRVWIFERAAH